MLKSISEHFWWPSMLADTLNYCKSCNKCQLEKLKFSKYKGSIRSFTDVMPFSSWVVDYAGPMDGEYIFVAICVFSSYAIFCKADDCTAATTAQIILERIICQFGVPLNIYSDRGSAFTSDIITEISQKLGIRWRASCSYSPRTQGLAERLIQDIKNTCSSMDWDLTHLPLIQLYHNTSLIGNSPLTPFEVIHGIKPNISPLVPPTTLDSNIDLSLLTAEARHTWLTFRTLMRERNSDVYASRSKPISFQTGDEVFRVYITANRSTIRTGPHKVTAVVSPNMYQLHDITYPVPDYQLHSRGLRDPALQLVDNVAPTSVTSTPLYGQPGDLVLFESYDSFDGSTVAVDVGEWVSESEGMVTINRYWFNTNQQWLKWDGEFTTVPLSDIKLVGLKLTRDSRIPQKILRTFLH
jgi:hypothetical protein